MSSQCHASATGWLHLQLAWVSLQYNAVFRLDIPKVTNQDFKAKPISFLRLVQYILHLRSQPFLAGLPQISTAASLSDTPIPFLCSIFFSASAPYSVLPAWPPASLSAPPPCAPCLIFRCISCFLLYLWLSCLPPATPPLLYATHRGCLYHLRHSCHSLATSKLM